MRKCSVENENAVRCKQITRQKKRCTIEVKELYLSTIYVEKCVEKGKNEENSCYIHRMLYVPTQYTCDMCTQFSQCEKTRTFTESDTININYSV